MTENQLFLDKATALYFYYRDHFIYGNTYESVKINEFVHKFDMCNVRINGYEYSMGILHQKLLTTVIFCDKPNAFMHDQNSSVVYTLYAGKIGPRDHREHFYANTCKLLHKLQTKSSIKFLTAYEIIKKLGQIELRGSIPAPRNINRASLLEIVFDKDGRIVDIKEGL